MCFPFPGIPRKTVTKMQIFLERRNSFLQDLLHNIMNMKLLIIQMSPIPIDSVSLKSYFKVLTFKENFLQETEKKVLNQLLKLPIYFLISSNLIIL